MSSGITGKAAPKSIYQFRNVCYLLSAWWGLSTGLSQKLENDRLWGEVRAKEVQGRVNVQNALHEKELKAKQLKSKSNIPEAIPPELHGLYKAVGGK